MVEKGERRDRGSSNEGRRREEEGRRTPGLQQAPHRVGSYPEAHSTTWLCARNVKCDLSLKFNSTRMKRKCFTEL